MRPRILLLTDIPPSHTLTAGLVLDRLCRFIPPDALACFSVTGLAETRIAPSVPDLRYATCEGPNQFAPKLPDRWWTRPVNLASSFLTECKSVSFEISG